LDLPHELVQNASESYSIFPEKEKAVADSATFDPQTKEYRTSIESIVYIDSQDHKRYTLPFTWVFTVADGKITKSFATDHPITEVK
jgi:hypothetical protein